MKLSFAERMHKIFVSSPVAHGEMKLGQKGSNNKVAGNHHTVPTPMDVDLWSKHLTGEQSMGCIPIMPDSKCYWACIDFDKYDGLDLAELEDRIRERGYPITVCRSKSGGAHLLMRFRNPVSCTKVRGCLKEIAINLNITKFDLYPRQDTVVDGQTGNWLNMPYFNEAKTNRYAIINGLPATLEEFLNQMEANCTTLDELKKLLVSPEENEHGFDFKETPPCLAKAIAAAGGKISHGSRNDMVYNFGVLARMMAPEAHKDELIDSISYFNFTYIQPPISAKEVAAIAGQVSKKSIPFYKCVADPIEQFCDKQVCKSRAYGLGFSDAAVDDSKMPMVQLYKYRSNPPIWEMDIDGVRVRLTDPKQFMLQHEMDKLLVNAISKRLPAIKAAGYLKLTQKWLDNQVVLDMPEEASATGQFLSILTEYCDTMVAKDKSDINRGCCWYTPTHVYVTVNSLVRYIQTMNHQLFDNRTIVANLKFIGAESKAWRWGKPSEVKGGIATIWAVPLQSLHDSIKIPQTVVDDNAEE